MRWNYITLALVTVAVVFLVKIFWGPPWTAPRIIGLAVAIPCCILLGIARVQLGRAFSIQAQGNNSGCDQMSSTTSPQIDT